MPYPTTAIVWRAAPDGRRVGYEHPYWLRDIDWVTNRGKRSKERLAKWRAGWQTGLTDRDDRALREARNQATWLINRFWSSTWGNDSVTHYWWAAVLAGTPEPDLDATVAARKDRRWGILGPLGAACWGAGLTAREAALVLPRREGPGEVLTMAALAGVRLPWHLLEALPDLRPRHLRDGASQPATAAAR